MWTRHQRDRTRQRQQIQTDATPRPIPQDIDELCRELQLSTADRDLLAQIADEAVTSFDSETEALRWFDDEVKRRNPNLWWTVRTWLRSRAAAR